MNYEHIIYEKKDGIARLTINRPQVYNAFTLQTLDELIAAFQDAGDDAEIGVCVLTAAGDKAFCSGGSFEGMEKRSIDELKPVIRYTISHALDLFTVMRRIPKPIIGAIQGLAVGGGNQIVIACDLAIACKEHARFGQTGVKVGTAPIVGAANFLPVVLGEKKAKEICYLCHQYSADEAVEMGLINKAVPCDRLHAEVEAWCQEILDKSPTYIGVTKVSCNTAWDMFYSSYYHGVEMCSIGIGSPEQMEGALAFIEKRKPDFRKFRRKGTLTEQ